MKPNLITRCLQLVWKVIFNNCLSTRAWLCAAALMFGLPSAHADMAVLIQITDRTVLLEHVKRSDPAEATETTEAAGPLVRSQLMKNSLRDSLGALNLLSDDETRLFVRWYNAEGDLIHYEVLRDPRYIHGPGTQEVVLPEATQLLRAPNEAILLRVKPRGFRQFIDFAV